MARLIAKTATNRLVATKDHFREFERALRTTIGMTNRLPPTNAVMMRARKSTDGLICLS